jgi:hypothetical protein
VLSAADAKHLRLAAFQFGETGLVRRHFLGTAAGERHREEGQDHGRALTTEKTPEQAAGIVFAIMQLLKRLRPPPVCGTLELNVD